MGDIDITQALSKLQAMAAAAQGQAPLQPASNGSADFSKLLQSAVDKVNASEQQADKLIDGFEKGENTNLTEVMIALQKARLSFQAMLEVRNKLVGAYQDIMNMQI